MWGVREMREGDERKGKLNLSASAAPLAENPTSALSN